MVGKETMAVMASQLHSKFSKGTKERSALVYCAPFFDKEDSIWTLEIRKKGSDIPAQVRFASGVDNTTFETAVGEINNFLMAVYE